MRVINGLGYILTQEDDYGQLKVIEYGGRSTRPGEKELEALAVIEAVRQLSISGNKQIHCHL